MTSLARPVLANVVARLAAMAGLTAATVVVARVGGAADVGSYALLRMLPGIVGVLAVAGLPGAMAYFLSPARRETPRLWPTLAALLVAGAVIGTAAWVVLSPVLTRVLFRDDTVPVVALAGLTVSTQLLLTVGKTVLQGLEDRRGGDLVIAAEEIAFLPCYGAALLIGLTGSTALIVGLGLADLVVAAGAWRRVAGRLGWRRGCADWAGRPDPHLLRSVASYGVRGQLGGLIMLLNLRLDFVVLGALTGPAVLGVYAVASKYAELLRLPGTALTWVSYPRLAAAGADDALRQSRRLLWPSLGAVLVLAGPMFLLAGPVMRVLYGSSFDGAVQPARILLAGMLCGGAAGVASGYLYARGRPGLNSVALGCGLVVTVLLDLLLIPRWQDAGAAVASTVAYLTADLMLIAMLLTTARRRAPLTAPTPAEVAR